ncbi:MAG: calcium-binding protein [bacterium]
MERIEKDKDREYRIEMEVVVDAYDEEERSMGWYYYLDDKIHFPFKAKCIQEKRTSPLKQEEEVEVTGMAPEDECEHDMLVEIQWQGRNLAIPLSQIEGISVDDETKEAIEDWHYWVNMGYEF